MTDRTTDLSFEWGDPAFVETLVENRLAVIKDVFTDRDLDGVARAYRRKRAMLLHRRAAMKALSLAGVKERGEFFRAVRPKPLEVDPYKLPIGLRAGGMAVSKIITINTELFGDERLERIYGDEKKMTVASLPATYPHIAGTEAFPLHQDSVGQTGLGYGTQALPTTWTVYKWAAQLPVEPDYTFNTERGDLVVSMQRMGECPEVIPREQGFTTFAEDGTPIHSGLNSTGLRRYGLNLAHREQYETPFFT